MILLLDYLTFCLDCNFINYPKDHLSTLKPFLKTTIDQTIYDTNIKYLGKVEFSSWEELLPIIQTDPTIEAILFYRLERQLFLNDKTNKLLPYLASTMRRRTGSEIYYSTEIEKGFNIQHGFGIVIGPRFKIGKNFIIHQGVTLGQKNINCPDEKIVIGNNVSIFANASILGHVRIGDNAKIGANSVLLSNVEDGAIYAGIPAKRIK
jgi:serine O-acetyltransferase